MIKWIDEGRVTKAWIWNEFHVRRMRRFGRQNLTLPALSLHIHFIQIFRYSPLDLIEVK